MVAAFKLESLAGIVGIRINLRTAKTLGLEPPLSMLIRADELLE